MRTLFFQLLITAIMIVTASVATAQSVKKVFKDVNASVVVIHTKQKGLPAASYPKPTVVQGLGSGVLISADGKAITSEHSVKTADEIIVEFMDGELFTATVVAAEPAGDVALLQLDKKPMKSTVAALGNSDQMEVGDQIFVIGAPYGVSHMLTVGHISARHTQRGTIGEMFRPEFFLTDAAVNQGNSGSPVFNMKGEVIGIVSSSISKSGGFEGVGFVATSNMARWALLERKSFWSGLDGFLLTGELASMFNLPQSSGMLVEQVAENSPAALLGLRGGTTKAAIGDRVFLIGGDIILSVDGISLADGDFYETIRARLSQMQEHDTLTMKVLRFGKVVELRSPTR